MKKWISLASLFFLAAATFMVFSCKRDLSDAKPGVAPNNPLATIMGGPGAVNGTVNQANINSMIAGLATAGIVNVKTTQASCSEVEGSLDSSAVCPNSGSVDIQNCSINGDVVTYDIVFTDCMTSSGAFDVTMNGTISIDAAGNIIDVIYTNYEIEVPPNPPVIINLTVSFYVLSDGSVISYTVNVDQVTVNGLDDNDAPCTAIVTVDTGAGTWTSDGGCGLPTGPITY